VQGSKSSRFYQDLVQNQATSGRDIKIHTRPAPHSVVVNVAAHDNKKSSIHNIAYKALSCAIALARDNLGLKPFAIRREISQLVHSSLKGKHEFFRTFLIKQFNAVTFSKGNQHKSR
jgi:hypothetical protein